MKLLKHLLTKKASLWLLIPVLGIAFAFSTDNKLFDLAKNLEIYASVIKELNKFYVDEIDPASTIKSSIEGMLEQMDPYTEYYPEEEIDDFLSMTTGKYQGIGVIVDKIEGNYYFVQVEENEPAFKAGVRTGDQILEINGLDLKNNDVEPSKLIKGQAGTILHLKILKPDEISPKAIEITRQTVVVKNVLYAGMIQKEIGYIQLDDFNENAAKEVKAALIQLKNQGMKKLVLDIRNNPGGLLTQAVDVCNLFLPKDKLIVDTKGKVEDWNKTYKTLNQGFDTNLPLVVLINGYSASAAEIVAGVMQDYDRAVLLGQKSYGKGLVQITRDLPYRTKLKITTAKYYIPSGRCIQAIDYQHKKEKSKPKADSSTKTFLTQNKRKVKDGGGIAPDILIKDDLERDFLSALYKKDLFFLFSLEYFKKHKNIASAKEFQLSENDFYEFIEFIKLKKFTYQSPFSEKIKELEILGKAEKLNPELLTSLEKLKNNSALGLEQLLKDNQKDIKYFIEHEITAHYYFRKGVKEWSINKDDAILEGIKVLNQEEKYNSILKKHVQ